MSILEILKKELIGKTVTLYKKEGSATTLKPYKGSVESQGIVTAVETVFYTWDGAPSYRVIVDGKYVDLND